MTLRFNENDSNVANGIVKLDDASKMPPLDGSQLTNLTTTPQTLDNNFDAYQVVIQSTDATIQAGRLYMITASCKMTFPSGTASDRCAFIITNDTAVLTLEANIGSSGSALRFCVNGSCYGNNPANSTLGALVFSTTQTYSGKGKCLEFIRTSDGIAAAWFEKNHLQNLDTSGGTTVPGNWANFDNVLGTNAATGYTNKYTLVSDGTDWRWRTIGQDVTSISSTNGSTVSLTLPTNHQYMDHLIYLIGLSSGSWTSGFTVNLTNLSSLSRDLIHMKPVMIILRDATLALTYNQSAVNTFPYYLIRFSDTTSGVTFQQIVNYDAGLTAPYTTASNIGITDKSYASTSNHQLSEAGIIIVYNADLKKWYKTKALERMY